MKDRILTPPEVARWLRTGKRNLYRLAAAQKIPHIRIGRYLLFRESAIEEWLAEREVPMRQLRRITPERKSE